MPGRAGRRLEDRQCLPRGEAKTSPRGLVPACWAAWAASMRAAIMSARGPISPGGAGGVDGAPLFAALGRFDIQGAADLDDLAVHGDGPRGGVDLADGQGGQLAPPQPGVGSEAGHQLIPLRQGGEGVAEPGDISRRGDLGRVDIQAGFPGDAGLRLWCGPVAGLPVHFLEPRVGQVAAGEAGCDQGGDAPPQPGAFLRGRRGVHDGLHVAGLDVLARQPADHRGHVSAAQPGLGVGVLTRPRRSGRVPSRGQVVADQVGSGQFQARRVRGQPRGDFLDPGGEAVLGRRLALPPSAVLVPHRPPAVPLPPRRVHRDPPATSTTTRPSPRVPSRTSPVTMAARCAGRRPRGVAGVRFAGPPRASCGFFVVILERESAVCAMAYPSLPASSQVRGLAMPGENGGQGQDRTADLPLFRREKAPVDMSLTCRQAVLSGLEWSPVVWSMAPI